MKRVTSTLTLPAKLAQTKAEMIKTEFLLTGDMEQGLDKLADSVGESVLRSAGYAGAQVFMEEAKLRAPVGEGVLRDNIIVVRADEKSDGAQKQTYVVTVRSGKFNQEGDAFYWRFVEFGTVHAAAKPFIRPAFEAMKQFALQVMLKRMAEKIKEARGS